MGEGVVFLILLGVGFYLTQRTFIKEVALSKQQKNFLLSITHELKTPLASVKLYLQTLQKRELDEEKKASVIGKAVMDTDRLTNLVDNILLATQIEQGTYPFHSEKLNFSELIFETVAYFNVQGELKGEEKKSVVLSPSFQKELHVIGDRSALSSLLLNLIDNGLKYAEKDSVVIDLKKTDNNLLFSVSNQGMVLSSEEKDRIFDKFYRVGDEDTRKKPGTGLGLFIVKYIVEKHKGSIVVIDNVPLKTRFLIREQLKICLLKGKVCKPAFGHFPEDTARSGISILQIKNWIVGGSRNRQIKIKVEMATIGTVEEKVAGDINRKMFVHSLC